mmetsp:Transcript_146073/g.406965  ORF Transcript_146073/g.406965 Transcript_146073/m.406965 type:complete len:359 (+) Transcript_146073:71-1147(+)|eukprot:CAMPEP_0179071776 /NCGR_PEP_ID=MMETSP0796-20121207/31707_1 /TAXON_ID=73915 /ORGANISM="Pyrodinium bahamense, Strain pbaha01" /LENGTH=358 /DNA_ID=CAMNT_0020768903 /DNA_START=55 /DNA_END=1131 /DNA_ORIENTATION=+
MAAHRPASVLALCLSVAMSAEPAEPTPIPGAAVAAAIIQSGDADGNSALSRHEFQGVMQRTWMAEHVAGFPILAQRAGDLLGLLDGDASGQLELPEVARAFFTFKAPDIIAEVASNLESLSRRDEEKTTKLRARAMPAVHPGRLLSTEESVGGKRLEPDSRCEAPVGYPTDPEGWICVNDSLPIYCSGKHRMLAERACGFGGRCQAGVLGDGGCQYPMCISASNTTPTGDKCKNGTIFRCNSVHAHGRWELQPVVSHQCRSGTHCQFWWDGPPPSRRRRTRSCRKVCHPTAAMGMEVAKDVLETLGEIFGGEEEAARSGARDLEERSKQEAEGLLDCREKCTDDPPDLAYVDCTAEHQ